MATPGFRFKQFEVFHDRCAMKVGMDGVTLGAWAELPASVSPENAYALDVGTGCGLIALMLAQRYPLAKIDAVEIGLSAALQAADNVRRSPWPDTVSVCHGAFPDILEAPGFELPAEGYHLVVSNPPFFKGELRPVSAGRNLARHVGDLTFPLLIQGAAACLHPEGLFSVIIPYSEMEIFDEYAYQSKLYLRKACSLVSVEGHAPKRILLTYAKTRGQTERIRLVIKSKENTYTSEYQNLTKDYYLNK